MAATRHTADESGLVGRIRDESIPAALHPLIEQYAEVRPDRDRLLWKWLWHVFPAFRLSSVPSTHHRTTRQAKFCLSLYMTVLDDIAERHRDRATFEAGRALPFEGTERSQESAADAETLALLERAWTEVDRRLRAAPRGDRFRELTTFDLRQSLNTMDYNRLVNERPSLLNRPGCRRYDTHNMLMYLYVDIDLAFSPRFDDGDLADLRDLAWRAQELARIGNWVTTWERELHEGDFTSMVVTEAVERGVVSRSELRSEDVPASVLVQRIRETEIEHDLLLRWNDIYGDLQAETVGLTSVDADAFVDGVRYLLEVDVKMRGFK